MIKSLLMISALVVLCTACSNKPNATISNDKEQGKDSAALAHIAKEERNKKVIQESLEAFNAQDLDGFLRSATNDMIDYFDGTGMPVKGKDSIKKAYQVGFGMFGDVKGEDLKYSAEGDWVMVWGKWSGRWIKDLNGQKATGKPYLINDVDVFKLNEQGKITEHRGTQMGITIALQVGYKFK
jgi:ketosteroid isomerase-like protein